MDNIRTYTFVNCTPHEVTLFSGDGAAVAVAPSGLVPRIISLTDEQGETVSDAGGNRFVEHLISRDGEVSPSLPMPTPGVLVIVPRAIAELLHEREDLRFPDDFVRNDKGVILGARALGRFITHRP